MKNLSSVNSYLKEKVFAGLILVGLLVVYYNSVVIRGNSLMSTVSRSYQLGHYHYSGTYWHVDRRAATVDPVAANQINLPAAYLENHYLKTFQIPLWNPYSGLGRPYNADMNSYTFFLPIYPFKLFPSLIIHDLFLLFRLFAAGFFLFLLLRLYKCPFWIAIAGASFFIFNSHFHAFIDMDHLNVTMFLPAMAYFLTKFLFSIDKRYLIGFIFCSAGSFFGGNPNEYVLIHLYVTVYFIFLVSLEKFLDVKKKANLLVLYLGAFSLSIFFCSVKLIPFIEFWKNSVSARMGGLLGTSDYLPFKKFLGWILFPNQLFGGPNYIGYLILSLMFYSLFNLIIRKWRFREKIVAFHFILLFLLVSKICGARYINWLGTLPIFNNINYVKYCSLIYYLISVISAFSLTYLLENIKETKEKIKRLFLFLFCLALPHLVLLIVSGGSLFQRADNSHILLSLFMLFILISFFLIIVKKSYKNRAVTNGALLILIILAVLELRVNNHQYYRKRFKLNDKAPYTQFLLKKKQPYRAFGIKGTLMPNHNLIYPIPSVNRIFAIRLKRPAIFLSMLISNKFNSGMSNIYYENEILNNSYLDLLNTRYYISESVLDSVVIDPEFADIHRIKSLLEDPRIGYTHRGNLYYYPHWGWQQLANSSIDIPIHLPDGDLYLKSTALAFNFDWHKRKSPENKLYLKISVKQATRKDGVYERILIPHKKKYQDFFDLKVNLSKYAGKDVIINFTLRNPGARTENDRALFFGDLRITYNKIRKTLPLDSSHEHEKLSNPFYFQTVPYEEEFSHHAIVYRNNRAMERGFVLYNVKQVKNIDETMTIMTKEPHIYKHTALIEGASPSNLEIGKRGQSKVTFLEYRPNYLKINLETTENGVFILSDAYYPGWRAYLNKKRVKIYPAFYALRAVFLPKGRHQLVFRYRPWTFFLGAILTFLSLIFLGYGYLYFSKSIKTKMAKNGDGPSFFY